MTQHPPALERMLHHLPAILAIIGQLAIWAFYAAYAMAGVVMAAAYLLELLHKLLNWITRGER
jgi:hypothetical protein